MALVSLVPLVSKFCLPTPTPTHHLMPIHRKVPNLGMCRQRYSTTPSMSMSFSTSGSKDDAVRRCIGDHHSNLWDHNFIDSLSTSYQAPCYREHADRVIGELKAAFASMSVEDGALIGPLNDLLQRLCIVDSVERLGIDRHFKNEIKSALDYVYSYWNEKGIGCGRESADTELNSTALAFRTLRLHGYTVSSDVLEQFKNQKGKFTCSAIQTEGEIRGVVNLFRASLVAFPGEKVMEEAQIFSTMYLKEALQKIPVSSLSREIEYVLEYGWHTNLPRLEARIYIDVFGQDTTNETPYMNREKLVELAKLEFNIFHSLQKRELQYLSRWWKAYGFPRLTFARHRYVEYYTLASCIAIDPKHSAFRLGFAKLCHLLTVLEDIYDTYGTMGELELFTEAFKSWDPASVEFLPEYMKGVYMAVYNTIKDMGEEAVKVQGRDTVDYVRQAWEAFFDSVMNEAKWISSGYLPAFEEYLDNGKISFGCRIGTLQPILTLGHPFPHHALQEIDYPSEFNDMICAILRLKGDTRCYKAERARGEEASAISSYMKDKPGLTEEDALNHINAMLNNLIKELNWELLRPDTNVPISCKKTSFDICRVFEYGYKDRDGFSVASVETKNLVMQTVLETVTL